MTAEESREAENILARLKRVEGQVRGIHKMIREGRDCEAIVTQMVAARAALDKANALVIAHYLETCFSESQESVDLDQVKRIIAYLVKM